MQWIEKRLEVSEAGTVQACLGPKFVERAVEATNAGEWKAAVIFGSLRFDNRAERDNKGKSLKLQTEKIKFDRGRRLWEDEG